MDCYGQGYCMANQTCQCLAGFSGADCNQGLQAEQDPFVSDYDIRKQNGDSNSREDGNNGDQDGDKKSDDQEDDKKSDDQENEVSDEESESLSSEEDEGNEAEIDPRVQLYANRVAYLERVQDIWFVAHMKSGIRIDYWNHSLKHNPNNAWIKNKISHHQARAARQIQVIGNIDKRLVATNQTIDSYLTESQKKIV